MLLGDLLKGVKITGAFVSRHRTDPEKLLGECHVTGVAADSSSVYPGDVFVCIRGSRTDGHIYAGEAVRRGASAIVAQKPLAVPIPVITVENTRYADAFMRSRRYGDPQKDMTVIAVTGTNGKTSVSYMIYEILRTAGYRCGLVGTVKCMANDRELDFGGGSVIPGAYAAMTTPDPEYLYRMLYEMRLLGVTYVVMEASSHALSQHKLSPITPDAAVFTGLSPEHLDYHGTMDNYLSAKSVLFRGAVRGIINFDDPYGEKLAGMENCKVVRVGAAADCDVRYENTVRTPGKVSYNLVTPGFCTKVSCPMPGRFGVTNSVLAAAAVTSLGVGAVAVREGLKNFGGVPGRMETVAEFCGIRVMRDYAHTPDALKNAVTIAGEETEGKLWLLFGCGGDRDRSKRHKMGKIASDLADFTVITSDNPRSENRDAIIADIMTGFDTSKPHKVIPDRREAIRYAAANAKPGDTVFLAGKGHENYEITADGMHPFDEVQIVRSAIEERQSAR